MLRLTDGQSRALSDAVQAAIQIPALAGAVDSLYARLQTQIDRRRPICSISGRCCRFEEYGHSLFVTTAELAVFQLGRVTAAAELKGSSWNGLGCPFQVGGLCGVHAIRPFGCRIYFCDATSTEWQREQYERFHADLRAMHVQYSIAYFYVEWREGLKALSIAPKN